MNKMIPPNTPNTNPFLSRIYFHTRYPPPISASAATNNNMILVNMLNARLSVITISAIQEANSDRKERRQSIYFNTCNTKDE